MRDYVVGWYPRNNPDDLHCGSMAASKDLVQAWCDVANKERPDLYHFPMRTSERTAKFDKVER